MTSQAELLHDTENGLYKYHRHVHIGICMCMYSDCPVDQPLHLTFAKAQLLSTSECN